MCKESQNGKGARAIIPSVAVAVPGAGASGRLQTCDCFSCWLPHLPLHPCWPTMWSPKPSLLMPLTLARLTSAPSSTSCLAWNTPPKALPPVNRPSLPVPSRSCPGLACITTFVLRSNSGLTFKGRQRPVRYSCYSPPLRLSQVHWKATINLLKNEKTIDTLFDHLRWCLQSAGVSA